MEGHRDGQELRQRQDLPGEEVTKTDWNKTAGKSNFRQCCRYDEKVELEDAVHTAILTLKEGFEGQGGNSESWLFNPGEC